MWIVFLKNFKKLFTTEDIIESTKAEVNKILIDFNRNTERNITVYDNASAKLKALNAETEKKIKMLTEMEKSSLGASVLNAKVSQSVGRNNSVSRRVSEAYEKNKSKRNSPVAETETVVLTLNGEKAISEERTLFDEEPKNQKLDITVLDDGSSYKEIPVVVPPVYVPEGPVIKNVNKNDIKEKILQLFDEGFDPDLIATQLGCSTTEVQFALAMAGRI